ncbi:MAG: YegP family protein [Actinomycetota bacterium]|nr:YegP family protein [Actinomycetota bacterium]
MPGKYVIKKGSTGKFRFSLLSTNGQVVATSETYNSKASCMNGVRSVQKLAADAVVEDQTTKEWAAAESDRKAAAAAKKARKTVKGGAKKAAKKTSD